MRKVNTQIHGDLGGEGDVLQLEHGDGCTTRSIH